MYICIYQPINISGPTSSPFVRSSSSCAMLRTGEGPTSPAEKCQTQQAKVSASKASPPKSVDRSHGRIQQKSGKKKRKKNLEKNYELLVELLVFTCFYMCLHDFMLNVGGLQFCLVFLLMLNDLGCLQVFPRSV